MLIGPHKDLYMDVHVTSLIIAQKCKQSKCLPTGEWKDNLWYAHTMDYSFTNEKKQKYWSILQHERTSKTYSIKEVRHKRLHTIQLYLYRMFREDKFLETESRFMVAWGWVGTEYNTFGHIFLKWWNVSNLDGGDACPAL